MKNIMKKAVMLGAVSALTIALAGCGAKAPTFEELKDNISEKAPSSFALDGTVNLSAEAKVVDPSDEMQMVLSMLEDQYDVDLTKKTNITFDMDIKGSGERSEAASHVTTEGSFNMKSNVSALDDLLQDALEDAETELFRENYTDYEEELTYTKTADGDWYYEDYEANDDKKISGVLESFIDYCIAHNENADDDKIAIETVDGSYVIKYDLEINNEFAENVDKSEKKALQQLLDDVEIEADLDDLFEYYEEYGEYADVAVPFSLELKFTDLGTKKDRDFALTGLNVSFGGTVSCDWDEDTVSEILDAAGAPLDDSMTCGLELSAEATIKVNVDLKYDEELDVEIPSKVTKNAESYEDYFGATAGSGYEDDDYDYDDDDYDYDYDEEDDDDYDSDDDDDDDDAVKANSDGSYTLYSYDDDEIFSFNVPKGWELSSSSSKTYYSIKNSDDEYWDYFYVTATIPSGVNAFYEDDADDYDKEQMENYELVGSAGGYDIYFYDEYDEVYAVKYLDDEFTSICISAYVYDESDYYMIDSVDTFMDFVEDNF